jgi:hypothetical protein
VFQQPLHPQTIHLLQLICKGKSVAQCAFKDTTLSADVFVFLTLQMKHFPVADAKTRMLKSARTQPEATTLIIRINIRQHRDKIIFPELNLYRHCLRSIYYPRHSHYPQFYTVAYRGEVWGVNPPPPKFWSFDKAEPDFQFRGKYISNCLVFLFHHPN